MVKRANFGKALPVAIQANLSPVHRVNAPLAIYSARPSWAPILKVG